MTLKFAAFLGTSPKGEIVHRAQIVCNEAACTYRGEISCIYPTGDEDIEDDTKTEMHEDGQCEYLKCVTTLEKNRWGRWTPISSQSCPSTAASSGAAPSEAGTAPSEAGTAASETGTETSGTSTLISQLLDM